MADESLIGRQLNNFKIESLIGQGGMATVYVGRDVKLNRPVAEALRIGRSVANALDYAHQKGVIHRDVKPANILISKEGQVVLSDFGLALIVAEGTLGEVFGSSHYIAPEQARRSADAVPQSDLYSLGVVLYQMLTGVVPFDDPSPTAVALQHLTQPPPPPRDVNPGLNQEIESVLLKALSKSPTERYQSGAALIGALEAALQNASPSHSAAPATVNRDDNLIGLQLDEYRLEELLGKGGMAAVYQGVDARLNRRVALKVIDTPYRADAEYIERFEREARAIAQLEHPHIVSLYRYGEAHGLLYMATQYIKGQDLHAHLSSYAASKEEMPPREISRITRQICQALDYAHQKGVIHRDVKPSNIMLDKEGDAYLTDFGLVLLTDLGTRGEILGSPHYLSPEQAVSSAGAVPQSDLYAIGVILYRCFTGDLPFDAEDPLDVAMQQMSQPPTPPTEINSAISPALESVILKALEKEPEKRYASGLALADALDAALKQKPETVVPPAPLPVSTAKAKPAPLPLPPVIAAAPQAAGAEAAPDSIVSRMSKEMASQPKTPPLAAKKVSPPKPKEKSRLPVYAGIALILLFIAAFIFFFLRNGEEKPPTAAQAAVNEALESTVTQQSELKPSVAVSTASPTSSSTASPTRVKAQAIATDSQQKTPLFTPTKETPAAGEPDEDALSTVTPSPTHIETLTPTPTLTLGSASLTAAETLTPTPPPYRLAFTKWDGGKHSIWTVNLDGSKKTWLSDYAASPSWTPDGERIVFLAETGISVQPRTPDGSEGRPADGGLGIFTVNLDGTGLKQLTTAPGNDSLPVWTPDSRQIVFRSTRNGFWQIYAMNSDGSDQHLVIPDDVGGNDEWAVDRMSVTEIKDEE